MADALCIELSGRRGDFALEVRAQLPARGVTAVFGRSGSGKTTLLRAIAGLERMRGRVSLGDDRWQDGKRFVPPERRRIGYVFQDAALLPHLTVRANLHYALRRAESPRIAFDDVVGSLGLEALLSRHPGDLSGGEKQRVAIARALLQSPVLLLMDEPLASLDLPARDAILGHLEHLRRDLTTPIVYVTHAVDEVARLADRVAWMDGGRIVDPESPETFFARTDVGASLGDDAGAVVPARVVRHDDNYHLTELASSWGPFLVHRLAGAPGDALRLRVCARDISIALEREHRSSILNVFSARVDRIDELAPGEALVRLTCPAAPDQAVLARLMRKSVVDLGLRPGLDVLARIKGVSVR